jgi:hypothetical protein
MNTSRHATPQSEVYALIEQDLLDAINALPTNYPADDVGRVTQGAAQGLLAKVYLTLGDFSGAEQYAMAVINSGDYALYPSYGELFQPQGENSSESLSRYRLQLLKLVAEVLNTTKYKG